MNRTLAQFALIAAGSFVCGHPLVSLAATEQTAQAPLPLDQLRLFAEVFGDIKRDYVRPVGDDQLLTAAIKGMVSSLDPHSSYLDKADYKDLKEQINGRFAGVGIEVSSDGGLLKVTSLIEDTPGSRAGIQQGDVITSVNGKSVRGVPPDEAIKLIRGNAGTKVTLTVYRKSAERTLTIAITRAMINMQSVKAKVIEPGYAYIRITSFQERTTPELASKLRDIAHQQPNLKGLILDLRNNGGGVVQSAVGVAGAFLPPNAVVVSTNGQLSDSKQTYRDTFDNYRLSAFSGDPLKDEPAIFKTVPMIVLTNGYTASASEIVAGALQDEHRALIIGKTTFGKGSVQTASPLTQDTALRLTIAYYYTPAGRSIQNVGIHPDIPVDQYADGDPDDVLVTREVDYSNHLANTQDPNEKKELERRERDRLDQLRQLEEAEDRMTPEQRQKERDRKPVEFGSADDFMLSQALNKLEGKSVQASKSALERNFAQSGSPRRESSPEVSEPGSTPVTTQ